MGFRRFFGTFSSCAFVDFFGIGSQESSNISVNGWGGETERVWFHVCSWSLLISCEYVSVREHWKLAPVYVVVVVVGVADAHVCNMSMLSHVVVRRQPFSQWNSMKVEARPRFLAETRVEMYSFFSEGQNRFLPLSWPWDWADGFCYRQFWSVGSTIALLYNMRNYLSVTNFTWVITDGGKWAKQFPRKLVLQKHGGFGQKLLGWESYVCFCISRYCKFT